MWNSIGRLAEDMHICGTPVDSDAKKTFLDDIDFSETEELSDAINADEGKTKIFNVEEDDISKTFPLPTF